MDAKIQEVKQEIREVQQQIDDVEEQLTRATEKADVSYLRKKEDRLRQKKDRLRQKENRFLEKELLQLKADTPKGEPISKKPKRSPAEHPSLDWVATNAERSRYVRGLLTCPDVLPISVKDLRDFLSWKSGPLPVSDPEFYFSANDPDLVKHSSSAAEMGLAQLVNSVRSTFKKLPKNEADSSHKLRTVTGDFLDRLDDMAPAEQHLQQMEATMDSASNPSSASAASALVGLMRPDFALYVRGALILRWENEIDPANLSLAGEENVKKLKIWSPLYYGELPYVIGGCCGGGIFQWLRLSPKGKEIVAEPISKAYNLWIPSGLAELLLSVVQMHRLLQKLQERLTTHVPVKLYEEKIRPGGSVLLCPQYVLKTLKPRLAKEKVEFLGSLYKSIAGSKYIIQLEGKIVTSLKDVTKLRLYPVGHPNARPCDLEQLKSATHDILHGLMELHEAGYTHRDLRWENCIRSLVQGEWKWIIIDLESAGEEGDIWEGEGLVNWDAGTLELNKLYTKRSDMYELGKLIVNWLDESGEGVEGKQMRALGEKMMKKCRDAKKMLENMCKKDCFRCPLFNT